MRIKSVRFTYGVHKKCDRLNKNQYKGYGIMLKLKDRQIELSKTINFFTNSNDEWYILPTITFHSLDWEHVYGADKKEKTYGIAIKWLRGWVGITKNCKKRSLTD
jgi:hypothetical protein